MSTEVTTEIMNEAIGVFMGYKMYDKRYPRNHGIGAPEAEPEKCMIIQKAKYHTSWDALMPVGKKIRDMLNDMQKKRPPHTACHGDLIEVDIHCAVSSYDIVNAHKNMYIFIKWYNECQQKQTNEQRTNA